jgi:rubrerythrin
MDKVVNEIINIDRETVKIKDKTKEIIANKEKELRETIQRLEKEYIEDGKLESESMYNDIVESGKVEISKLQSEDNKILKQIDNLYRVKKDKLVEDLWTSLFTSKG